MRRLVIADSHLGQRPGDSAAMAGMLSRAQAVGVGEVVYLGDAFQYLIGMPKFWTGAVRDMLALWQELRQTGMRVVLIEGNRDFFLDEAELAGRIDFAGRRYEFEAGPHRFRLVHGDRVNRRDRQYLFWAMVSKSVVARVWARLLPRPLAVAIVRSMEARLARTNFRFRYHRPVEALRREAVQAATDGVDVCLWGHFHDLWTMHHDRGLAMILPGWLETRCGLLVEPDGQWCFVDQHLRRIDIAELGATTEQEA